MSINRPLVVSLLIAVAVQAVLAVVAAPYAWEAVQTLDGDVALRLDRVMELHEGGRWYDSIAERLDAPYGELVNWSRPLDVLLYAGAAVGGLFTDFRSALILWGGLVSPLLMLVFLPVLQRMAHPFLGAAAVVPALALLLAQPKFPTTFLFGRADHHSIMTVLFGVLVVILVRAGLGDVSRRAAVMAGLTVGFACWVSVESILAAALGGAVWLILWIWENDRRRLWQVLFYGLSATAVLLVAVAAEHPPQEWLRELHAKVSIVHPVLAAISTGAVAALLLADRAFPTACPICRTFRAALAMSLAAALAVLIFPALLKGPLAADGAGTSAWHLDLVGEFRPLWPDEPRRATMMALHLTFPFIALLSLPALMRRRAEQRKALVPFLIGLLIYIPLSLIQNRWAVYANVLSVVPVLLLVSGIMNSGLRLRIPMAVVVLLVQSGSTMAIALKAPAEAAATERSCDQTAMLRWLGAQRPSPPHDILLTYVSDGPEVIWNSRYRVAASNYLFDTGFGRAVEAFKAQSDEPARRFAAERGVALVLVCAENREASLYRAESGRSFHDRLADGDAPAWLEPVPLPEHLRPHRLYRTVGLGEGG